MIKMEKEKYLELKKKRQEIKRDYIEEKYRIKDSKKLELEEVRDQYKLDLFSIENPLKAEKYRLKVEKKKRNRILNEAPKRTTLEEIGNAITHGIGAILGIVFLILMVLKATEWRSYTAAIVYGSCFFFQMFFSCMYHAFRHGTRVKRLFRRFDYISIYLQIGGTYAPLYLIYMVERQWGFNWGISLFAIQWILIVTGITFIGVFGPGRIRWLHFTMYFAIGWSGVLFFYNWIINDLPLLFWILGGGIVYTLGMIPFAALKHKPVAHFIWHFVVLAGAILMWIGIYLYVF